jgi:hypothetical protein
MGNSTNDPKGAAELPAKAGAIKKKCAAAKQVQQNQPTTARLIAPGSAVRFLLFCCRPSLVAFSLFN